MKKTQADTKLEKIGYGIKKTLRESIDVISAIFLTALFCSSVALPIWLLIGGEYVLAVSYVIFVIFVIRVLMHAFPPEPAKSEPSKYEHY